jgi:[ribosomal protein S5]-alanine N-acetyltransferase
MYVQIETERLKIRPISINDGEFMLKLMNTEGWLQFIGDRNVQNAHDAQLYVQKILANPRFFYSVFELKTNQRAIGIVSFLEREQQKHPDIGFAILPQFAAKGYTFEACRSYLDFIISLDKYENIIGITSAANQPSIALLTKLGLRYSQSQPEKDIILSTYSLK